MCIRDSHQYNDRADNKWRKLLAEKQSVASTYSYVPNTITYVSQMLHKHTHKSMAHINDYFMFTKTQTLQVHPRIYLLHTPQVNMMANKQLICEKQKYTYPQGHISKIPMISFYTLLAENTCARD